MARGATDTNLRGLKDSREKNQEEEVQQEKPSVVERVKGLRDKLKLGPHHKMERFTVVLGATLSLLLSLTVMAFFSYRSDVANLESSQAVLTNDFEFSLSSQQGHVEGVYGNKDKTDVMVLLQFQNPQEMSMNAKNYKLFITRQQGTMDYKPKVSFSIFGSTGYGIIRFQNDKPLKQEVLDITIRANKDLSLDDNDGATYTGDTDNLDESFSEYDQARILVNVGANNVETLKNLKPNETDPRKLYIALVAHEEDSAIHEEIEKTTAELERLLERAKEYSSRLTTMGYIAPEEPWFIKGDYVDKHGVFRPATRLSQSFNINYWSKDIHDGYISQVVDDFSKFDDYMAQFSTTGDNAEEEKVEQITELKRKDGTVLDLDAVTTDESPTDQVAAKDALESLVSTWETYVDDKATLQRDLMRELLLLDADVQSQPVSYTEHHGNSVVTFY